MRRELLILLAFFSISLAHGFVDGPGVSLGWKPDRAKIAEIHEAGFKLLRLPFDSNPDVDLVKAATSKGLRIVVDFHPPLSWYSDPFAMFDLPGKWSRWAKQLQGFSSDELAFEVLNEPRAAKRGPVYDSLMVACIAAIREVSPSRWIVVSNPQLSDIDWFAGPLGNWAAPQYDRLIVPLHYYRPYEVTHPSSYRGQVGPDTPVGGGTKFDLADWSNRELHFQRYVNWCRENRVQAWLGEAGCYESVPGRLTWFSEVAKLARTYSVPVCWWGWRDRFGYRPEQKDAASVLKVMLER